MYCIVLHLVAGVGLLLASVILLKSVEDAVPGDTGDVPIIGTSRLASMVGLGHMLIKQK